MSARPKWPRRLATVHATELIRLQCYEGLDQSAALYEWNYQRQLLSIQAHRGDNPDAVEDQIFSEKYLFERPLLAAIRREQPPVLLIDEIDRADDEFEAFLLELLSDFQVSSGGTRYDQSHHYSACGADVQRHARTVGRVAPPLSVSLCRLPRRRSRGAHHHGADSGRRCVAVAADRAHGGEHSQRGIAQGARRRGDARLGSRAGRG